MKRLAAACAVLLWPALAWAAPLADLEIALRAWQPTGGAAVDGIDATADMVTVRMHRGPEGARAMLVHLPKTVAPGQGESLSSLLWLTDPRQPSEAWQPVFADLKTFVARHDRGQYAATRMATDSRPPQVLLALTWIALALGVWAAGRSLRAAHSAAGGQARWLWLAALAGWLLRAAAPHRLVMVHFGYLHLDQAASLHELPRYGPATALLNHALFWVFPVGLATVQWAHTVLGALTAVLVGGVGAQLAGPRAGVVAAGMVAALPVAVLDHGSESMLVPALLAWFGGALLLRRFLAAFSWADLLAAAVLLIVCALCRPDCLLAGPPAALLIAGAGQWAQVRARWRYLALAAAVGALALWPDVAFLRERTAADLAMGNLPRLQLAFFSELPERLLRGWLALDPRYFPLGLLALAAAGLGLGAWRRAAWLWLAALLWAVPMLLDFNESSKLRLHMPSALLIALAAAVALAELRRSGPRWMAVGSAALAVASAAATVPAVFATQNSDYADRTIAEAIRAAADGRPTALVVRAYVDEPSFGIHLYWPESALEAGDRWLSVADWRAGRLRPGERALGVIDPRCWAWLQERQPSAQIHPACAAMQAAMKAPLWHLDAANLGERGFAWYAPPSELPVLPLRVGPLVPAK